VYQTKDKLDRVLKVKFHPLSTYHLAVLTTSNSLMLFDLTNEMTEPEQTIELIATDPESNPHIGDFLQIPEKSDTA